MTKIRLGVLGATRGLNFALSAKKHGMPVEMTAVCDIFQPLLDKIRGILPTYGITPEYYTDFNEMLSKADIDAVVIANDANNHAPFAIAALNAGKHVLCEVLPVQTPAQAVALVEAVERSGKIYCYAENYCYFPGNFEAERLYREGIIGEAIQADCEFVNDLAARWHILTRGNRNHWRNYVPSTFYCTHSIGPMIFALRERAVRVSGFEVPNQSFLRDHGARCGTAAMEIMQLSNGVPLTSTHGNLRRPWATHMHITGTEGTLESTHTTVTLYEKTDDYNAPFRGKTMPIRPVEGISDEIFHDNVAMPLHVFTELVLGNPAFRQYGIDVYAALDMAMPGVMAYRSIIQGNTPVEIPDFRRMDVREKYRNDNICTDPRIASGADLLPSHSYGEITVPDSVYEQENARMMEAMEKKFRLGYN